ncbi:MAG: T9SS type A sorting domain-containing protein, partial [Flavobacteriales bacterium]|nr:T9SS type A sorting domain-containing protein [Flavobacteriales bacterium]
VITSLSDIDLQIILGQDLAGNNQEQAAYPDYFSIEIDSSVTVQDMLEAPAAYLYPNPVAEGGMISLQCGNLSGSTNMSIVNMNGQLVQSDIIQLERNNVVSIETSTLSTGMYLLVLAKEDQQTTLRFQVK